MKKVFVVIKSHRFSRDQMALIGKAVEVSGVAESDIVREGSEQYAKKLIRSAAHARCKAKRQLQKQGGRHDQA